MVSFRTVLRDPGMTRDTDNGRPAGTDQHTPRHQASRGRVPGPALGQHAWERWRGAAPPHRSDWQRCEHVRIQCAGPAVSTRGAQCGCEQRPARAPVMRRGPDAGERRARVTGTTTFATLHHTRLSGCLCPRTGTSLHARMNLPHACPPGAPPTMLALLSLPRSLRFHA